uniref:Uncharacterized protein n=1 Tax=Rhizobium rhizogenes TaxID=359 RepID=A0A7S5DRT1_RHIRH|nr:hypothetical protein pC6.5b_332 [Rhizobium rhizogenes]
MVRLADRIVHAIGEVEVRLLVIPLSYYAMLTHKFEGNQ